MLKLHYQTFAVIGTSFWKWLLLGEVNTLSEVEFVLEVPTIRLKCTSSKYDVHCTVRFRILSYHKLHSRKSKSSQLQLIFCEVNTVVILPHSSPVKNATTRTKSTYIFFLIMSSSWQSLSILEPVCCKKRRKKSKKLFWGIGDIWRLWMIRYQISPKWAEWPS